MVSVIDDMIEDYFRNAKEEEIERLKSEGKYDCLEGDEDGNFHDIKSDAEGDLDYPTAENTREVDALEMIVGTWSNIFGDEAPEPLDHEYFAALALAKIGEIMKFNTATNAPQIGPKRIKVSTLKITGPVNE
jgi:hypothetical protein